MEILKKILENSFDKKLRRLENRAISQINDLKYTKECLKTQEKKIEKFAAIDFNENAFLKKTTGNDRIKRNFSAKRLANKPQKDGISRCRTPINNTRRKEDNKTNQEKTPLNLHSKNMNRTKRDFNKKNDANGTPIRKKNTNRAMTPNIKKSPKDKKVIKKTNNDSKKVIKIQKNDSLKDDNDSLDNSEDITSQQIKDFPHDHEWDTHKIIQISNISNFYFGSDHTKKQNSNISLDEGFLTNPKNKDYVYLIASFLSEDNQMNLYSCSKVFKYNLSTVIEKIKKRIYNANYITSISTIEDKINDLHSRFTTEQLKGEPISFQPSRGSVKAVEILNEDLYNRIFRQNKLKPPQNDIYLIYRIFFQLLKMKDISQIEKGDEFWEKARNYILSNNKGRTGDFFLQMVVNFDFSVANVYQLSKIIGDKVDDIKPSYYSKKCGTTGLVIFLIKDALEYCGIIQNDKKNSPSITYQYYVYLNTIENRLDKYIDMLKS